MSFMWRVLRFFTISILGIMLAVGAMVFVMLFVFGKDVQLNITQADKAIFLSGFLVFGIGSAALDAFFLWVIAQKSSKVGFS